MNVNLRKIFLLLVFLVVSFFGINRVSAKTYKIKAGDTISGYYYINKIGTKKHYGTFAYILTEDNVPVFCIQPSLTVNADATYNVSTDNLLTLAKMSQEQWNIVRKIAYYGYNYGSHTGSKWYMATQMLIWKYSDYDVDSYFTSTLAGSRDNSILKSEMDEIMSMVNNHGVVPSFSNFPSQISLGMTITLSDNNGVLSNYDIRNVSGGTVTKSGNNITIKPTSVGTLSFSLNNDYNIYGNPIELYYATNSQTVMKKGNLDPVKVNLSINVTAGKIKLTKVDNDNNSCKAQGEATLVGAKYEIYNSNGDKVSTLTIGSDCTAITDYLPLDTYTIKEKTASSGYVLNTETTTINVNSSKTFNVKVKEKVKKGKIKILKYDKDNDNQQARGQATLVGAKYGIYNLKNELVETLITDENKQAISSDLPYGNYKVKEIKASSGYLLDTNVYDCFISSDGTTITINSKEKVIENWISILKQYDFVDENTTFLNAESNITFEIYYPNGIYYDSITTDNNGYATMTLPYGVWKFHQLNSNTGFEKIYDFYITVDENSKDEQYYNILNNKLSTYLQVIKIDQDTGKTIKIANTKFKILNMDTNQYISQYVGGKIYDTFETDNDGKFITYLKIEAGYRYKLVEISSPNNYLINDDGLEFTIGEDTHYTYTTYGPVVTITFSDKQVKGVIEVNKDGEVFTINNESYNYNERIDLEGIVFKIEADEDIMSADNNYVYYRKGTIVDTITTNNVGYAKSKELPLGKYIVYEYSTLNNYKLDSTAHKIELKQIDNRTPIVYSNLNMTNQLKKGILEFTKTDFVNSKAIPNTTIVIYTENEEKIFEGKTNKDGKVIISDLPVGIKMYIVETDCEGYILSNEKMYFEIKEDGEIVKVEMQNKPKTSKARIHKVDENNNPIKGVKIGIYNLDGELIFSDYTDENGDIETNISYGSYYWQEIETVDGFILSDEKVYFDVKEDGEIIQKTLINEAKQIIIPDTYLNDNHIAAILGIILTISGIGVIIYEKNKKK